MNKRVLTNRPYSEDLACKFGNQITCKVGVTVLEH